MSPVPLTVVAEIVAKPGNEAEVESHLRGLVNASRAEEGCVQYDLHVCLDEPGRFIFYENWLTEEMLETHSKSTHIRAFGSISRELLAQPARILKARRIA